MSAVARLVVPALRWDRAHGFQYLDGLIDDALELGVGGFLVEGGPHDDVAALISRLHAESRQPLLIAARAERGAGETFAGLTELPPFGAITAAAVVTDERSGMPSLEVEAIRRAARLTARELRSVGANWALAPLCDLDLPRHVPGVGSRAASDDPAVVGAVVAEWIDACQADAVIACACRFPGSDIGPFSAAVDAGVASVMVSAQPAPARGARDGAMVSPALIGELLRGRLGFEGIAATIPFDGEPGIGLDHEAPLAVAAIAAGCDVALAPGDLHGVCDALARAVDSGALPGPRAHEAVGRVDRWAGWARPITAPEATLDDMLWTRKIADRAVRYVRGARPRVGGALEVVVVSPTRQDAPSASGMVSPMAGAPPADVTPFLDVLRSLHVTVTESQQPARGERAPLAIVFVPRDVLTGGVEPDEATAVQAVARSGAAAGRDVVVVACCHPRGAAAVTGRLAPEAAVLCAWDASRSMLQAAARAVVTVR